MKAITIDDSADPNRLGFRNPFGVPLTAAAAPGRPRATTAVAQRLDAGGGNVDAVGSVLGSGTLIGYVSRAAHELRLRLIIVTVLSDSGEPAAGPLLSEQLDDDEVHLMMRAAAASDDPVMELRRFVTFRPERCAHRMAGPDVGL